ncbi:MAG: hypothetical protein ABW156_05840 [Jiangellaceae bacterium]
MAVETIAERHTARQVALARETSLRLRELWTLVEPARIAGSWARLLPSVTAALSTSQATAAAAAGVYVDDVLDASGVTVSSAGRINPASFAGIASDGRPLASLMSRPAITALEQIKGGATTGQALASGRYMLDLITRTQVADAGRVAVGTAVAARPQVTGYVRMIVGKTCSRCLILAGRRYRWNAGFNRHPRCDCRHVPFAEDVPGDIQTNPKAYFDSLDRAGQDELLGKDGAEAVRSGADIAKVVNARRGIQTADGRLYTREAAGRRPRLMPEQIFRDAKDRDDAIRLLRLHGYIT